MMPPLDYGHPTLGHTWITNEKGVKDDYQYENGYHNGPKCSVCGYSYCVHCSGPTKTCAEVLGMEKSDGKLST